MSEIDELLQEIEDASQSICSCVYDHNGEPNNGWRPNLEIAHLETGQIYWRVQKLRHLLKAFACQREIDAFEERTRKQNAVKAMVLRIGRARGFEEGSKGPVVDIPL